MNKVDIRKAIDTARDSREREKTLLMRQYDKEVYGPELRRIMELCEQTEHEEGIPRDNGIGWIIYDCKWCGKPLRYIGPDGKESSVGDV
jgi:hypothetical protein